MTRIDRRSSEQAALLPGQRAALPSLPGIPAWAAGVTGTAGAALPLQASAQASALGARLLAARGRG